MRYEIKNQPFTVLTLHMEEGEGIKCQSGAMAWMSPGIAMETKTGGLGGMFSRDVHQRRPAVMILRVDVRPRVEQHLDDLWRGLAAEREHQ